MITFQFLKEKQWREIDMKEGRVVELHEHWD